MFFVFFVLVARLCAAHNVVVERFHPSAEPLRNLEKTVEMGSQYLVSRVLADVVPSMPSSLPTGVPSNLYSTFPSTFPSSLPSGLPSSLPSGLPSSLPSRLPTSMPSRLSSTFPSSFPSSLPSNLPTGVPSLILSEPPSVAPSGQPSLSPSSCPSGQPSLSPSSFPSGQPSIVPSGQPSTYPSAEPTSNPSFHPVTPVETTNSFSWDNSVQFSIFNQTSLGDENEGSEKFTRLMVLSLVDLMNISQISADSISDIAISLLTVNSSTSRMLSTTNSDFYEYLMNFVVTVPIADAVEFTSPECTEALANYNANPRFNIGAMEGCADTVKSFFSTTCTENNGTGWTASFIELAKQYQYLDFVNMTVDGSSLRTSEMVGNIQRPPKPPTPVRITFVFIAIIIGSIIVLYYLIKKCCFEKNKNKAKINALAAELEDNNMPPDNALATLDSQI